jgi:hypothetical protein
LNFFLKILHPLLCNPKCHQLRKKEGRKRKERGRRGKLVLLDLFFLLPLLIHPLAYLQPPSGLLLPPPSLPSPSAEHWSSQKYKVLEGDIS